MITDLEYKPALQEVVGRHRRLWGREMRRQVLAEIRPAELLLKDPLAPCPHIPGMVEAWDHNYRTRLPVQDDSLPVARVSFGSAAFAAYLGAEVIFDGSGGWCKPFLKTYDQLDHLQFDPRNEWILRQQEACRCFEQASRGKFAVCETEPIDGLNLVEALRGSAVYTDVFDYPSETHRLLDFSVEFNIRLLEMQRKIIAPSLYYEGGLFSMFRIWLPGDAIWMSVDAYGNCSPRVYREFGTRYLQRAIDHFGGGWIHIHSFAIHLIPDLIKLKGVLGLGIYDDPNAKRGFPLLPEIRRLTGDLPLQVDCTGPELDEGLKNKTLPGGVMYVIKEGVRTVAEANKLMERVRDYVEPA